MCTKNEGFRRRSKGADLGEIKVFGFMRCSRDLLPFYYALRGRLLSYLGFTPTFLADLRGMVLRVYLGVV